MSQGGWRSGLRARRPRRWRVGSGVARVARSAARRGTKSPVPVIMDEARTNSLCENRRPGACPVALLLLFVEGKHRAVPVDRPLGISLIGEAYFSVKPQNRSLRKN